MAKLPLKDCNRLFFDSETGGLYPTQHDFVEVAAILTDPSGERVVEEYSARVFPIRAVDAKAAEINGYSREKWATTAVPLAEAMRKIVDMSRNALFVAHNAAFDWGFLEAALRPLAMRWNGDYHKADTVAMAIPLLQHGLVPNIKLQTLVEYFGIDPGEPHRALSDARACRQVYLRLMDIWSKGLHAVKQDLPETLGGEEQPA